MKTYRHGGSELSKPPQKCRCLLWTVPKFIYQLTLPFDTRIDFFCIPNINWMIYINNLQSYLNGVSKWPMTANMI